MLRKRSDKNEEQVQKLVSEIQNTWEQEKINELYEYFRPFFCKQRAAIMQHYHIGMKEAEDILYSTFLELIFSYDRGYRNRKRNRPRFQYVKFTRWLKKHIKRAWYYLDRITKKKADTRKVLSSSISVAPEAQMYVDEACEYMKETLSNQEYNIFEKHFVQGYTLEELSRLTGIRKEDLNCVLRDIKAKLQEYLNK